MYNELLNKDVIVCFENKSIPGTLIEIGETEFKFLFITGTKEKKLTIINKSAVIYIQEQ